MAYTGDLNTMVSVGDEGEMCLAEFFGKYGDAGEGTRMAIRHAMDGEFVFEHDGSHILLKVIDQ